MTRIVCQFSCGAASAVATKLALSEYGDRCVIVNAYILTHRSGPLKGQRFGLRELPAGKIHRAEPIPSCGLFCETAEMEYSA